jgi:hypothetical protein
LLLISDEQNVLLKRSFSTMGILGLDDYDNTLKLLVEILKWLDSETVVSFTDF